MSQPNKLSLWQKIKRLLTASAPQSVIDGISEPAQSSLADSDIDNTASKTAPKDDTIQSNEPTQTDAFHLKTDNPSSEPQNHSDTPIVDCLKQYFNDKQWHYTHYRPKTNDSQK